MHCTRLGTTLATLVLLAAAGIGGSTNPLDATQNTTSSPDMATTAQALETDFYQYLNALENCTLSTYRTECNARMISTLTSLTRQLRALASTDPALSSFIWKLVSTLVTFPDAFLATNHAAVSMVLNDTRLALLATPVVTSNGSGLLTAGNYLVQTVLLVTGSDPEDAVVALGSPRRKQSLEAIRYFDNFNSTHFKHFDFALLPSASVLRSNARIGVTAFQLNVVVRPLPTAHTPIYNSRVVDLGFVPGSHPSDDQTVSLYFKPAALAASAKSCAFWSASRSHWVGDACWTDPETPDVCHCSLAPLLAEDATGGQLIVYEYSDVRFDAGRVDRLKDGWRHLLPGAIVEEAGALMHNLSLIPGNDSALGTANHLAFFFLQDTEQLGVTASKAAGFSEDVQMLVKSLLQTVGVESTYDRGALALVLLFPGQTTNDPLVSLLLSNSFDDGVAYRLASQYRGPDEFPNTTEFAVTASRALLARHVGIGYIVYPVDWLLSGTPPPVVDGYQVHNWRLLDLLLSPRLDVTHHVSTPLELFYQPSTSRVVSRVGCAVWRPHGAGAWDSSGCQVNATPRGCRCDAAILGTDGGRLVVFEYSDVVVDRIGVEALMGGMAVPRDVEIVSAYLSNLTRIGHVSTRDILLASAALRTILSLDLAPWPPTMVRDLHVLTRTWAHDQAWNRARFTGVGDRNGSSAGRVAARDVNDILSNKAVVSATTNPFEEMKVVLMHLDAQGYSGLKTTTELTAFFQEPSLEWDITEEMFALQFSVGDGISARYAVVQYPKSKMFLQLSERQPAIFSYQAVDVARIYEVGTALSDRVPSSRLVTMTLVSGEPRDASLRTGCAMWTAQAWTSDGCEPVSEFVCACNLSTLGNDSLFLSLLVYEFTSAPNFSAKASLGVVDVLFVVLSLSSLFGLAGVLATAVALPAWRNDLGHKILVHLSLALGFYQGMRLYRETHHVHAALNRDVTYFVAFAVVTHYSRLTHYAWMLAMSWLQLRRLLTMLGLTDTPRLLLKVSLLAWGMPLVPLVPLLAWDYEAHFARPHLGTHLALHLVPGAVITLLNALVLVVILARVCACCGWGKVKELSRHGISQRQLARRRLGTAVMLFFLFGLPTVFEIANDFDSHSLTLEVLFKVFDPGRGLALFLFFVVLDSPTRGLWCRWSNAVKESTATMVASVRESSLPPSVLGLELRALPRGAAGKEVAAVTTDAATPSRGSESAADTIAEEGARQ